MSNIVPQHENMNGAAWNDIEDEHRRVVANPATGIKAVWIISGPIFENDKPAMTVGNDIGVPQACFEVIGWFDKKSQFQCCAYVLRQTDTKKGPAKYLTTVDAVESLTGLDFFAELPDVQEDRVEKEKHVRAWE